jgi:glycerate 2-kinase
VRHLVAAPDKFRGTADASQAAAAAARGAHRAGWSASEIPLADGGDGLLAAVGGEASYDEVAGPLGAPVLAEWRMVPATPQLEGRTAVIEMARASGLAVVGGAQHNRAVEASTVGTGQLVLRAVSEGAARVVVGCGGSATTDGGAGAVRAIGSREALRGARLVAACDVTTRFLQAATVFAPQKGATPAQVAELTERLARLAEGYRADFGVEVTDVVGGGAAGGLAGGLVALGAQVVSGFDFVADLVGLDEQLAVADLVMTGEGYLDPQSFSGKVVGGVTRRVGGRVPMLCVVGEAAPECGDAPFELVSLVARVGPRRARDEVLELIEEVVAEHLSAR